MILFIFVAVFPALKTNTMRFVDMAWPWGLTFLSIISFVYGTAPLLRKSLICSCFFFQGFRMGLGGLFKIPKMKEDYPRYQFAKMKMAKKGKNIKLGIVIEIMI